MKILFYLIVFAFLSANYSYAACYTQREAEAEQGLRIHSELMVIALNCRHMAPPPDLYTQYQRLTATNAAVFAGYENDLLAFFARTGKNSPEGELHSLRTHFANDLAIRAAQVRPDLFCGRYAQRIPRAASFTQDQMRGWAASLQTGYALTHPICKTSGRP